MGIVRTPKSRAKGGNRRTVRIAGRAAAYLICNEEAPYVRPVALEAHLAERAARLAPRLHIVLHVCVEADFAKGVTAPELNAGARNIEGREAPCARKFDETGKGRSAEGYVWAGGHVAEATYGAETIVCAPHRCQASPQKAHRSPLCAGSRVAWPVLPLPWSVRAGGSRGGWSRACCSRRGRARCPWPAVVPPRRVAPRAPSSPPPLPLPLPRT